MALLFCATKKFFLSNFTFGAFQVLRVFIKDVKFFASLFTLRDHTLRDHINFICSISILCIIEDISRCPLAINTRFFSSFSLKREYLKPSSPEKEVNLEIND